MLTVETMSTRLDQLEESMREAMNKKSSVSPVTSTE